MAIASDRIPAGATFSVLHSHDQLGGQLIGAHYIARSIDWAAAYHAWKANPGSHLVCDQSGRTYYEGREVEGGWCWWGANGDAYESPASAKHMATA